jgi:hypothetical protein
MLRLDIPETNDSASINRTLDDFQVQDGDSVRIAPILPYSEKPFISTGTFFIRESTPIMTECDFRI